MFYELFNKQGIMDQITGKKHEGKQKCKQNFYG